LRCSAKIETEAKKYAVKCGCDTVLCGHTRILSGAAWGRTFPTTTAARGVNSRASS
jgi:hypothetical protein